MATQPTYTLRARPTMIRRRMPMILTTLGKSPQQREKTEQQQRQEEKSITRTMIPLVCGGEGGRKREREGEG